MIYYTPDEKANHCTKDAVLKILTDINLQQIRKKNRKEHSLVMKLQSVFNCNVGTNKQPDLHGNCSVVNKFLENKIISFHHLMFHAILSTSPF